jgi:ubiquinone/menaquinone biosynthesis C-methylase UbiE
MFHRLAKQYDLLVAGKDYRSESRRLVALAHRYCRSGGREWLDVACGTGGHLRFLRKSYSVTGVDISAPMLEVAQSRLPTTRFLRADMRTFRLPATFDVISCLFSAIGHLRSEREVRTTFENFERHLRPGGVAFVEPWIDPSDFRSGHVHLFAHRTPTAAVARMAYSTRRGRHSRVRYHYLIGEADRGVEYFEETDVGLLVSRGRLMEMMRQAGLRPRFLRKGLHAARGLLVGVKLPPRALPP